MAESNVPVKALLARLEEMKRDRQNYDGNWSTITKYCEGEQWPKGVDKQSPWWASKPVYNKFHEFMAIEKAMLTDNKWGIDAIPRALEASDELKEKARKADRYIDSVWDECVLQSKLDQTTTHIFSKGTGLMKVTFDPDHVTDSGIGGVVVSVPDTTSLFVSEDATCVADCDCLMEVRNVSKRYLKKRWPNAQAPMGGGSAWIENPDRGHSSGFQETKTIGLIEAWYDDDTIEVIESFVEDGKQKEKVKSKYPEGRYTLFTDGGVVLEDKPNPYGCIPYARFVEILRPGQFWGACTLEKAIGLQDIINDLLREIIDNGKFLIHGVWTGDTACGVDPNDLMTTGPGEMVVHEVGHPVTRETGQPLPQYIFEVLRQAIEAFDRVVGLPDVMRGIVPSRQPVQTTMMQQESAEIRTRERARRIEEGLADVGKLILEVSKRFVKDNRIVRDIQPDGSYEAFEITPEDLKDWDVDFFVKPGSTLPLNRMLQYDRALMMRQQGIQIPDWYLIKLADLPDSAALTAQPEQTPGIADEPEDMLGQDAPDPLAEEGAPGMEGMPPELAAMMGGGMPPEGMPMQGEPAPMGLEGGIPPELAALLAQGGI